MRALLGGMAGLGLLAAGCANTSTQTAPVEQNGVLVYSDYRAHQTIPCDARPIQLSGNRTELRLTGFCRYVRVAGEHNDIYVEIAPGGTIEITGGHNDVTWRQAQAGPPPSLVDRGESNSFHHDEG